MRVFIPRRSHVTIISLRYINISKLFTHTKEVTQSHSNATLSSGILNVSALESIRVDLFHLEGGLVSKEPPDVRGHKSSIPSGHTRYTKATVSLWEEKKLSKRLSFSSFQLTMAPKETSHELLYLIRGGH